MLVLVLVTVLLLLAVSGIVLIATTRRVFRLVGVLVLGAAVLLAANAWVSGAEIMSLAKITFGMGQ
ncbi:MAG TPA: hypothetical protein VNT01_17695 [Symbiobacteriaceae bacterium]|nr:hypothetical protein [Symbiobacteriaceae bacterium]